MNIQDWMRNNRGEWYVLAQAALMLLVALAPRFDGTSPSRNGPALAAGIVLCVVGLAFAMLASLQLGRSLSPYPRPKERARLVETGVFSVVRHPIYAGLSLLALGWSTLWLSLLALVATVVLFIFLDAKARREERWLMEKFDGYARYRTRVRKFIPFVY